MQPRLVSDGMFRTYLEGLFQGMVGPSLLYMRAYLSLYLRPTCIHTCIHVRNHIST